MSVDIDAQLRALGRRLEHDAPRVDIDEVVVRSRPAGHDLGPSGIDSPLSLAAIEPTKNAPKRRRASLVAAAVIIGLGLSGLVAFSGGMDEDEPEAPAATPSDAENGPAPSEPAVFPIVGDHAEPGDGASFSMIGSNDPERISALVARRDGATLSDGLWITASREVTDDSSPADTAPSDAVGRQVFEVHGRDADVWTEPFDIPVQHVRFAGDPTLEVAGVDALAFMHAAGPDAILVSGTGRDGAVMSLQIGELPEDYDMIVEPVREPLGTIAASIGVENTATTEGNYVEVGLSNPLPTSAAYSTTVTAVDINGRNGWIGSGAGHYVTWEPVPGTFATVGGSESADESIALARRVEFVDRQRWQDFYDVGDPVF